MTREALPSCICCIITELEIQDIGSCNSDRFLLSEFWFDSTNSAWMHMQLAPRTRELCHSDQCTIPRTIPLCADLVKQKTMPWKPQLLLCQWKLSENTAHKSLTLLPLWDTTSPPRHFSTPFPHMSSSLRNPGRNPSLGPGVLRDHGRIS